MLAGRGSFRAKGPSTFFSNAAPPIHLGKQSPRVGTASYTPESPLSAKPTIQVKRLVLFVNECKLPPFKRNEAPRSHHEHEKSTGNRAGVYTDKLYRRTVYMKYLFCEQSKVFCPNRTRSNIGCRAAYGIPQAQAACARAWGRRRSDTIAVLCCSST